MNRLRVVVMGVSGCGKSTVGRGIARTLGLHFVEGDELHPTANVERMAAGIPLTDADRHGWLQEVAGQLANPTAEAGGVVVSCSALKRAYRDLIRARAPSTRFVFLHGARELLAERMAARPDHYMPPALLQSQLDTLEAPGDDEHPLRFDIALPVDQIVADASRQLQPPGSA